MPEDIDWNAKATSILKEKLVRRKLTHHELALKLRAIGIEETQSSIAGKLSRGTFSFTFFLQCMNAMRINTVEFKINKEEEEELS